jgi:RES domain-containing protein
VPTAWRIVKNKHYQSALTGEGARQFGGRWNTPGQAIIYAAESLSGALLEILVHGNRPLVAHYVLVRLTFPQRIVSEVRISDLPELWRSSPAPPELGRIGDQWCRDQCSAVLRVPSAIVPVESNFLINPAHRDFRLIEVEGPMDYVMDERLL